LYKKYKLFSFFPTLLNFIQVLTKFNINIKPLPCYSYFYAIKELSIQRFIFETGCKYMCLFSIGQIILR